MSGYLANLTVRLSAGLGQIAEDRRERHAQYFLTAQRDDGGWGGREGESDLYYTGFALRSLAVLGQLDGEVATQAASFLQSKLQGQESIVDFLSLIYGSSLLESAAGIDIFADASDNWRDAVAQALNNLRREDGGFAKGAEGMASSTYHSFLVLLCLEMIERPVTDPEKLVGFIRSQEAEDGGFREIRASKRAGVNPTAAAIGSLRILDALDDEVREDTIDFLADMQSDEGGFLANTRIPIADLLSTFTATLTLQDLGGASEINLRRVRDFVQSMERPEGGFHGAVWDEAHDVEYSFYGIGCLAILTDQT